MGITLRDYQRECVDTVDALESGSHLVQMATGLGKTVTFSRIARKGRMLVLSHRDELVYQPVKYFDVPVGIEKGPARAGDEEVVSASVQTLSRRLDSIRPGEFDIVVTDEAHHAIAPTYRAIYDRLRPRLHVGFTATPRRGDDRGLGDVFEDIVFSRDLKWGISHGYLCDIDCRRVMVDWSTRGVKSAMGDFRASDLDRAVNNLTSNEQVAEAYGQLHVGQTLVFATSVGHAEALSDLIPGSVVVSGKTPVTERREILKAFTAREIECLINYGVFTEGTDIPLIETVLLARPTRNPALYTQMVGRGLRLYTDPETGYEKRNLRLIDCMGATDNLSLCTPATLIGLNEADFPKAAQRRDGSLMELERAVREEEDTPSGWVLRARRVDVLRDNGDALAWTTFYDGSRHLSGTGWSVDLSAADVLGHCTVTFTGDDGREVREYKSMADAESAVGTWLTSDPLASAEPQLWDGKIVRKWGSGKASARQRSYISRLLGDEAETLELDSLSKREAGIVIDNALARSKKEPTEALDGPVCPLCGKYPLKSTSNGNLQCSSNRWHSKKGVFTLVGGCGFRMFREYGGEEVTEEQLTSLALTGRFTVGDQTFGLEDGDVVRLKPQDSQ